MNIVDIIKMYNEEGKNLNDIAKFYGKGKSTIQRFIIKNGYSFNPKLKRYEKLIDEGVVKMDNVLFETTNTETVNNETYKYVSRETMVNGSYTIPQSLNRALKLKAVLEDKKVIDIVREAIENVVDSKYFDI